MKLIFVIVVALIIPAFFVMMFVQGTYGRLTVLRSRCETTRTRLRELQSASAHPDDVRATEAAYEELATEYDSLRRKLPSRWVAAWFGFQPIR